MEILFLEAEYGDAIVIKTVTGDRPFTIVVDGGPQGSADDIVQQLVALGHIDLMVLTHFDEDHIIGLIKYLEHFQGSQLPVDRFWCNCAQEIDLASDTLISTAGYENANNLACFLREQTKQNPSFIWAENVDTTIDSIDFGDLKIDVLSPSDTILSELKAEYEDYVKTHNWADVEEDDTDVALVSNNPDKDKSIDDLVNTDRPRNVNLWNKASIAFLLQAEGKKVLMLGDADADVVAAGLEGVFGEESMIDIDLVKLSHHGSKHNISERLLKHIKCNNYYISTNGGDANYCLPDRKTMALILRSANRDKNTPVVFNFNYPIKDIEKRTGVLLTEQEKKTENCVFAEKNTIAL